MNPEEPVRCARPGCGVPFTVHTAGPFGRCFGFLWVEPPEPTPRKEEQPAPPPR